MSLYTIRVEYDDGRTQEVPDVVEYVSGFRFLYMRQSKGTTFSFDRKDFARAYRKLAGHDDWRPIPLRNKKQDRHSSQMVH